MSATRTEATPDAVAAMNVAKDVAGWPSLARARQALYDNLPYLGVVGIYVLSSKFILEGVGRQIPYSIPEIYATPWLLTWLYLAALLMLAIGVDVFWRRNRPGDPATWQRLGARWLGTRQMVGTLIVLLTLPALLNAMSGYRLALTDIKPFTWDPEFMRLDRWLHFGRQPWEWLQPVIGHPAITVLLDRTYLYGWISMMWICTIWQAVHGREPGRLQYFLSFSASWILLGSAAAIFFSSAGPVYFGRVTGMSDPYVPLMTYLNSVDAQTPLAAVADHARLWDNYRHWGGITAMPSMHMAITTIVGLTAVRAHRWLAFVVVPLWVLLMIGSIHLGWHYAIDGYASTAAAGLIWYGCGRFASWWTTRGPGSQGDARDESGSSWARR